MSARKRNPHWRDGWDLPMRRFIARKSCSAASEGGEQWSCYDMWDMFIVSRSETRVAAELVADALEFLSLNADVDQFRAATAKAQGVRP